MTRPGSPLIAALQQVLADEHAAVYAYGVIGAHLTGTARARATGDWIAHQRARDSLEATLLRLGSRPAAAAVAYEMPGPVRTRREATAAALVIEDRIAAAYLGLVAAATAAIREQAALQVRAAALRAAAWRGSTVAFPGLPGDGSLPAGSAADREHVRDPGGGGLRIRPGSDRLRPRPPVPPAAVAIAAGVDVLGQRHRGRIHHVQARGAAGRGHHPGSQAAPGEHVRELFQPREISAQRARRR